MRPGEIRNRDALAREIRRDEIVAAIRRHPVVVVAGDTGSGKSTQLPKFCLAAGRGAGEITMEEIEHNLISGMNKVRTLLEYVLPGLRG